jgi:hypothetical protein
MKEPGKNPAVEKINKALQDKLDKSSKPVISRLRALAKKSAGLKAAAKATDSEVDSD